MKKEYDVIIIGSGIGGLVCGAYLAKNGCDVLIIEKNDTCGGCCSTLKINGQYFNSYMHSFGSYRSDGILNKILKQDLGIERYADIKRKNPTNTILFEDKQINISDDLNATISHLMKACRGEEKDINNFFNYLMNVDSIRLYLDTKEKLMDDFLNDFFTNEQLKKILKVPSITIGSPLETIPAFAYAVFLRDMLFDSGYYLPGGFSELTEALVKLFNDFGGQIINSSLVDKLIVKKDAVIEAGVGKKSFRARYFVSNGDFARLCNDLIGLENIPDSFIEKTQRMSFCYSAVIQYIGLKKNRFQENFKDIADSVWIYKQNFKPMVAGNCDFNNETLLISFPSELETSAHLNKNDTMGITVVCLAPYQSEIFWKKNIENITETVLTNIDLALPSFLDDILFVKSVTPVDIERHTFSCKGAIRGWASTPDNNKSKVVPQGKLFKNLFQVGHWATLESGQGGLPMVAYTGKQVSKKIHHLMGD